MIKKKVWRYYCEHCRKGRCSSYAISEHEKRCIKNPKRQCRMCDLSFTDVPANVEFFLKNGLQKLKEHLNFCPACILAAIVQSRPKGVPVSDPDEWVDFDFKEACKEWWTEKNASKQDWP